MERNGLNFKELSKITQKTFNENDLEIFEGNFESKMEGIVSWIDKKVERKQWSNEEISLKFAERSAKQILTDGDTGFMNPCSDLTLVGWALLKKNGFEPALIVEKLKQKKYDFIHMHFALEFLDNDILYFLDFATLNKVLLRKGEYHNQNSEIDSMQIKKIDNDINFDQNMRSILNGQFDVGDFKLEYVIKQLQKDNTEQTYINYINKLSHEGNLYLDSSI